MKENIERGYKRFTLFASIIGGIIIGMMGTMNASLEFLPSLLVIVGFAVAIYLTFKF